MTALSLDPKQEAFLDMIAYSEGVNRYAGSADGYNVLVGGKLFDDFSQHPRILVTVRRGLKSTAAGRYQFIWPTWSDLQRKYSLPDFTPESQDAGAIHLITEANALGMVDAGDTEQAIHACSHIWASFPGAGYNQPEHDMSYLMDYYANRLAVLTE